MYVPGLGTETLRAICLNFNYGVHSFLFHFLICCCCCCLKDVNQAVMPLGLNEPSPLDAYLVRMLSGLMSFG